MKIEARKSRAEAMFINAKVRQANFLSKNSSLSLESALVATGVNALPLEERFYSAA